MGKRTMSIQQGLTEIKKLDNRIDKALSERIKFATVLHGKNKAPKGFSSVKEYETYVKGKFDSINDLMKRRTLIKQAIVQKNAETFVEVAGEKMTIAAAIERKSYIEKEKAFLRNLERQYVDVIDDYEDAYSYYSERLDKHIENVVGKDNKDKFKDDENVIGFFKKENEPQYIDPIKLNETIEEMSKRISDFEAEVDFVLTEANVENKIEFDDPTVE